MGSETPWSSLHPASVVVNLIPQTWRVVRMAWPLLLAILWRGDSGMWIDTVDMALVLFFFVATVGGTVKHWLILRYRFSEGCLEIRTGLFYRRLRTIDPNKVQNVELVRNLFHKMSGLVEVRIETASGGEIEGELSALNLRDAETLRQQLESARKIQPNLEVPEDLLVENGWFDLFRFGATALRFGAAFVVFGLVFEAMTRMEPESLGQFSEMAWGIQGAVILIAILSGAWLWGILSSIVRHFRFRLHQTADALVVEGGLFTRRRLELPLHKVQVVSVTEPWLRRLAGFGSVVIETAAARSGQGGTERHAAMAPVVEHEKIPEIVAASVEELDIDPWTATLMPPHRKAMWRAIGQAAFRNAIIAGCVHGWFGGWAALLWFLVPMGVVFAVLDYRYQGWLISPQMVTARSGYLTRSTVVLHRSKIQTVSCHQGIFMRRLGLGRLRVNVAGRGIAIPLLGWDDAVDEVMALAFESVATEDSTTEEVTAS